jgi:multisubunit Na+/H+ antiporter MnhE subunit
VVQARGGAGYFNAVRALRGIAFWLIAFVFAFALWMVHSDSAKLPELLAGGGVAAIAATGTELVRRQRVAGIAVRPSFLRSALTLVPRAVGDCATLTRLAFAELLRSEPVRGSTVTAPFGHGGDDPEQNGRRALAQALGSFAPGTIVIGIDAERQVVIAHRLPRSADRNDLDPLGLA